MVNGYLPNISMLLIMTCLAEVTEQYVSFSRDTDKLGEI